MVPKDRLRRYIHQSCDNPTSTIANTLNIRSRPSRLRSFFLMPLLWQKPLTLVRRRQATCLSLPKPAQPIRRYDPVTHIAKRSG